ncbi:O-antigen ligase family protein [Galbibacter sp. PAP.153]|uniref:O-antigen ligase family protein n=1 Tax=Galbibacter sp. PAP.153 TaxID=3104623 RepID=UPI0030093B3D
MINRSYFFSFMIGVIYVLFTFEAQIFFSFLTTTRIATLIVSILFIDSIIMKRNIKISRLYLPIILFFIILIIWAVLNLIIHFVIGGGTEIKSLITIILITLNILMLATIFENNKIEYNIVIDVIWVLGLITTISVLFFLISNANFNLLDSNTRISIVKNYFNSNLVSGTSRFFYGLIALNIFSVAYALSYMKSNFFIKKLSLLNIFMILIMLIISNSRQNLLFLLFLLLIPKILSYQLRTIIQTFFKVLGAIFLFIAIISFSTNFINVFKKKYIERTSKQLEEGSERTITYQNAINDIQANPIFGMGMGEFEKQHSITTHNGYLWIGTELGIFPLIVYTVLLIFILSSLRLFKKLNKDYILLCRILYAYIVCFIMISNNLNELFKDYIFYIVVIIYFSILASKKYDIKKNGETTSITI